MSDAADEGTVRTRRPLLLPGLLLVLLIALLATSVLLVRDRDDAASPSLRPADIGSGGSADSEGLAASAVVVARQAATAFFTLDYQHVDADIARMAGLTTGDFRSQYDAQSAKLKSTVVAKRLTISASLPDDGTATEYLAPNAAQVLVAVDVATVTRGGPPDQSRYRTRVLLTRVDNAWQVSGLDQVG